VRLPDEEPEAGPWWAVPAAELLALVLASAGDPPRRPRVVAVDGRGASGKSTLAALLHRELPASSVVHTDDIAWHEPLFGWGDLLADAVLRPLHQGQEVSWRPPQWEARGRAGRITVPAGLDLVLVEGTGASHAEHGGLVDATVWVQADVVLAERRGIARDVAQGVNGDEAQATAFWHEWMRAELPFLARQQPWRRACVVVNGSPEAALDDGVVEISPPPGGVRAG
jgi:uridine kinase